MNRTQMTELALELAKRTKKKGSLIYLKDDKGTLVVNTRTGEFTRIKLNNKRVAYASGEFSSKVDCYGVVHVYIAGKNCTIYQHILMLALVNPNGYKEGLIAGHKDSVKWNNHSDNLEWIDHSKNEAMKNLLKKLHEKYPNRYTYETSSLSLVDFIASKTEINHSDIERISAMIDNREALDKLLVHQE